MSSEILDHYSEFGNVLLSRNERTVCMKCGHTNLIRWHLKYPDSATRPDDPRCDNCGKEI